MKKILFLGIVLLSVNVSAQVQPNFMVDMDSSDNSSIGAEALPFNIPSAAPILQNKSTEQPTPTQPAAPKSLFPELGEPTTQPQSNGMIRLIADDITIVKPPMNGIPFCRGTLKIENGLNVSIQALNLILKYGSLDIPISYSNIKPLGGVGSASLVWAGENCNAMTSVPQITVKSCIAGPLRNEACHSKIQYVPVQ